MFRTTHVHPTWYVLLKNICRELLNERVIAERATRRSQ
jgi:hypothetical protein